MKQILLQLFLIFSLFITFTTHSQPENLITVSTFEDYKTLLQRQKYTTFIFLSPDCPICQKYVQKINALDTITNNLLTSSVIGVFTGNLYEKKEIQQFISTFNASIQVVLDPNKLIVNELRATTTPEAFIVNNQKEIVYSGAIDDQFLEIGKKRNTVTKEFLKDAFLSLSKNQLPKIKKTKAVGCIIE